MRAEFLAELSEVAAVDERVVLLTADLGFSVIEQFAERFPDRFVNVGVAEQNLIGIATGMARDGFVPFVYSIATFLSMRPYEFIRNGPVLHQLPVRLIGTGGGFDYGHGGITHFSLEDVAIFRAQPDLAVIIPADAEHARLSLRSTMNLEGPVYFRVARAGPPIVELDTLLGSEFPLGQLLVVGEAAPEVALISMGPLVAEAVRASRQLNAEGVRTSVGVVSSFNPFPVEDVARLAAGSRLVLSLEAHYRTGGLGSAVAEVLAERGSGARLLRLGVDSMPRGFSGSPEYLLDRFGLTADAVVAKARSELETSAPARPAV